MGAEGGGAEEALCQGEIVMVMMVVVGWGVLNLEPREILSRDEDNDE